MFLAVLIVPSGIETQDSGRKFRLRDSINCT